MSQNITVTSRFFLFFSLVLFTVTGCKKEPPKALPPVEVTTLIVEPKTIPAVYEFVGFTESSHPVQIRSRVEGYLSQIAYTEGSFVNEGDLLFQIDPSQFQASLQSAEAELKKQQAILWDAQKSLERYRPLYEKKAASLKDVENATARQLAAEAAVDAAQAQVTLAKLNLSYTSIKSPINGLSTLANYREGALIMPAGHTGLLTTISVVDPIWARINVSENDLLKFYQESEQGTLILPKESEYEVKLIMADGTIFPHDGRVNFAAPTIDQHTGTMIVRGTFPNPDKLLKPGQFIRAQIYGGVRPNAITVPQKSVQQGQKGMYVFVVDKDHKAQMRSVEPGDWYQKDWIITSGLKAGDEVIVDGVSKVRTDETVIVKAIPDASAKQTLEQKTPKK